MNINLRNYLTEMVGTFFLVFTIGMVTINPEFRYVAPFIIGLSLSVMIFIGGHISGGHYNPAVTTAVLLQNDLTGLQWLGYLVFQIAGASLGGVLSVLLKGASANSLEIPLGDAFMVEFLYTFLLVFAVLCLSVFPKIISSLLTGITVGLIITIGSVTVGSISGASFNPAVVIGSLVLGVYEIQDIVGILIAIFLGSCFAAFVFSRIKSSLPKFDEFVMQKNMKQFSTAEQQVEDLETEVEQQTDAQKEKENRLPKKGDIRFATHKQAGILRTSNTTS